MLNKFNEKIRISVVLLVIFIIGLGLSGTVALGLLQSDREVFKTEFRSRLSNVIEQVEVKVSAHLSAVKGLRAYFSANGFADNERFYKFVDGLRSYDIGSVVQGWAPRVPTAHQNTINEILKTEQSSARFINDLIDIGAFEFAENELGFFPIASALPQVVGDPILGIDLASLGSLNEKLADAIRQDEAVLSLPLKDFKGVNDGHAVVAVVPFYRSGLPTAILLQRQENTLGVVFSVIDLNRIIQHSVTSSSIVRFMKSGSISMGFGIDDPDQLATSLFSSGTDELPLLQQGSSILKPVYIDSHLFDLNGLPIKMTYAVDLVNAKPGQFTIPVIIFVFGMALTLAFCSYVYSLSSRERHVNALVYRRTRELELNQKRLRDMAEISSDWFWETDTESRFTEISERFQIVTGVDPQKFIGKTRVEALGLSDPEINEFWQKHLQCIERREKFADFRYSVERENGDEAWLSISGKPIYDEDDKFVGYHGSGRDVTEEEQAKLQLEANEQEMQRYIEELEISRQYLEKNTIEIAQLAEEYSVAKERAEASEKSKSEFLASMSHEIRTPMTGVMGFADLLLDGELGQKDREKVTKIKLATQSLLTIIDDILDLSKLEAGRLEIEEIDFNLHNAVDEGIDLVRERARVKGLTLSIDHASNIPDGINADPTRFRQVLINLIGNAVKFTQDGEVSVHSELRNIEGTQYLKMTVRDTGIGISEENQKRLFQDFTQADASTSRSYAGTGLGLSISKRLVELMGGSVGLKSEVGIGSEFWFTLPFRPATEDVSFVERRTATRDYVATRPLHILVAEDNLLNQRIVEATLQKYGHTSDIVENGLLATEALSSKNYDLVLMDVRMPEMNGTDATMVIRGADHAQSDIPIIALTADAMEEHIRGYLASGMDACVTKPIDRAVLLLTMNQVLNNEVHVPRNQELEPEKMRRASTPNKDNDENTDASVTSFLSDIEKLSSELEKKNGHH